MPLLARKLGNHSVNGEIPAQSHHRSTPIFLPSPTPTTRTAKRRKLLVTTTQMTTIDWMRRRRTVRFNVVEFLKVGIR
jgi:hypothetical protein